MARKTKFTVFDMMDEKGVFEQNPANACSPQYKGPIEYPKMLYHPMGAERMTEQEQRVATPLGVVTVPAKYEMIHAVAHDEEEENRLVAEGWHRHPSQALAAAGKEVPAIAPANRQNELEKQVAELQRQLAALQAQPKAKGAAAA